jgi:hypothetical protein
LIFRIGRLLESNQRVVHQLLLVRRTVDYFDRPDQTGCGEVLPTYSGGSSGTLTASIDYGGIHLDLLYKPAAHAARIAGVEVSLAGGENLVFVDHVTRGKPMVTAIAMDLRLDGGNQTVASILSRSQEATSFLRCDQTLPSPVPLKSSIGPVCDDLTLK